MKDVRSTVSKKTMTLHGLPHEVTNLLEKLGERLKLSRVRRNMTQKSLASAMFCTRQTVSKMERGDPSVSVGVFLTAAFCLQRLDEVEDIFIMENDILGQHIDAMRHAERSKVREKIEKKYDF